ncbi:hypothetical protein BDR03DRAFT_1018309 [Suillus americanus]|nr:hypothetical protein BDR03DRAFT_1018309 [Suillus americanus]
MLEEDLDSSSDEEDLHPCNTSTILDALDQMEVDNDPEADDTESDELDEIDVAAAPNQPQRIPTPPLTTLKKRKRGTIASHNPAPGPVTKEVSYIGRPKSSRSYSRIAASLTSRLILRNGMLYASASVNS